MKLIIDKNRKVYSAGTWGTKNENDFEIVDFEFPAELDGYNKRIVYYLGDERVWDAIVDNKAYITNAITTKGDVKAYVWCTKENTEREADTDFRTQLFEMNFYENENADSIVPTPEQVDGFNTMLTEMNNKIDEVDALETTIETAEAQRQEAEATRVSNENTRETNESTRQTNEQTRQIQEAERERKTDEAIGNIEDKTAEYNANAEEKTNEFNDLVETQKLVIENYADTQLNAIGKKGQQALGSITTTTQFALQNISLAQQTGVSAVETASSEAITNFNTNATNKTNSFNSNATEKTTAFDDNASTKTSEFNTNAESKTSAFNDNATSKTNDFNDNAIEKTTEFNNNAQNKIDEYDEHIVEYQAQIDELQEEVEELSENMPWNTTEQATEISVDDAAKYSRNKLELFGNTEQDNTKITYKCNGTETGDYYLTYNSISYYFTMPTIESGNILVFDTIELKLYLNGSEIATSTSGTGTELTFIPSPNPDYPQDIHVVTGENTIGVQGKNLIPGEVFEFCTITNTGEKTQDSTRICTDFIELDPAKQYFLSASINYGFSGIAFYDNTYTYISRLYWSNSKRHTIATTDIPNNTKYVKVFGQMSNAVIASTSEFKKNEWYLEEGDSNNTKYVPYYHADYPINLGSLELCKIENYQDKIFKNEPNNQHYDSSLVENAWYEYKKVAKYTVTENTRLYYPSSNHVYIRTGESFLRSSASLGSYYLFENRLSGFASMANWHFGLEGTGVIHLKDNRFNSSGEFTNYFREHPLDIYLPYTTAKNIQITDETLIAQLDAIYNHLALVKGTNHITITPSDLEPNMQLTYMQDLKSKLDNLDSRLALLE